MGSKCDVNIEYSLENVDMELTDVVINIPVPYDKFYFLKVSLAVSQLRPYASEWGGQPLKIFWLPVVSYSAIFG